jgi:hypothetical protein
MLGIAPIAHWYSAIVIGVHKNSFKKYFLVHLQIGQIAPKPYHALYGMAHC